VEVAEKDDSPKEGQMVGEREAAGTQRWVVGVDGSDNSVRALRWAAHNAPGRASTLRIVRAWSVPTSGGLTVVPSMIAEFRPETAYESLEALTAEMDSLGVTVEATVEYGATSTVLLDACDDADLLVIGTRGLGGFSRLLLGSTSHQCATHARVAVVVVPAATDADADLERIVVGMDASAGARAALAWTLDFAAEDAVVEVVGAATGGIGADLLDQPIEVGTALTPFHAAVDEVEATRSAAGRCERKLVEGHAAVALLDATSDADLLVVGERGRRGLKAALLGSVTTEVLHRADRPVVVVPVDGR
jgi:nucleotide-binding universal stress UspA family protein